MAYFCLTLVVMATVFAPLKNSGSIFEFYNPENPIIYVKVVTISRTEVKSVHFCFFGV